MYKMEYYSALEENEITNFMEKMDRFRMYNIKQGHPSSEKKKIHILLHMWIIAYNAYIQIIKQMYVWV